MTHYCFWCEIEITEQNFHDYAYHKKESDRYLCKSCHEKGKIIPKFNDALIIESLLWCILKCSYCEKDVDVREFIYEYDMQKQELKALCPKCNKANIVSITLKKEGE